jgi:hypothetical protein
MRTAAQTLALAGLGSGAGCSARPDLSAVTGTVTMNGQPLKNVKVAFQPDPDKGTRGAGSTGVTDDAGAFTLTFDGGRPGALVGHHRVVLTDLDVYGNVFVGRGNYRTEGPGGPKETPRVSRVPEAYTNLARTPVLVEVKPGMGAVTIEVRK